MILNERSFSKVLGAGRTYLNFYKNYSVVYGALGTVITGGCGLLDRRDDSFMILRHTTNKLESICEA